MGDRYKARPLPGQGNAPKYWGAWDTKYDGWHCYPGTGILAGKPQVFTSQLRVEEWVARVTEGAAAASSAPRGRGRSR